MAWQDKAACKGLGDLMFPERGDSDRHAKAVCAGCPVVEECLEWALVNAEKFGVLGGKSERERRRLRAKRGISKPRKPIEHGTNAGYMAHRRANEDPCQPCKTAHTIVDLERRERQAAA